ncbi:hypothetical protein SAMD00023519_00275 [Listeria monocytogenes]|nr:hypothetical protein SAMD00023519_00275 [Listeria monocytogenes]
MINESKRTVFFHRKSCNPTFIAIFCYRINEFFVI